MKNKTRSLSPGFTLVELLVVIAMIAVLVTITVTMVFRFRRSADKTVATNNLRQIQVANMGYAADHNGRFVPPKATLDETIDDVPGTKEYKWFDNPDFVSQIKGISATYKSNTAPDTTLALSIMDPAVVRTRVAGYKSLPASYGYTTAETDDAIRQSQLEDPTRSAAFITADAAFADYTLKDNIAYRHSDKAIVVYYDGHASPVTLSEITGKPGTDIFWDPVQAPAAAPGP